MQVCRQCSEILRQETTTFNSKEGVDRIRISSSDAGEGATCSYRTAHRRLAIAAWERLTFVCGNSSCNWSYGYLSSCKRHFQRAHTASEQLQYKCHINGCRRSEVGFFDISSLNRHVRHCHTDKKSMGRLRSIVEPKPPVTSEWRKHKKVRLEGDSPSANRRTTASRPHRYSERLLNIETERDMTTRSQVRKH